MRLSLLSTALIMTSVFGTISPAWSEEVSIALSGSAFGFSPAPEVDETPEAFSFAPLASVEPGDPQVATAVVVAGVDAPVTASVSGDGAPALRVNGGTLETSAIVENGDAVEVSLVTAPGAYATTYTATLTIGTVSETFTVTTRDADVTPNAFSFPSLTDQTVSTLATSASATITGIEAPAAISISGDGSPEYSLDGGASWTSAAGSVAPDGSVRVRLTTSSLYETSHAATLTIGGVSGVFIASTGIDPDVCYDPANVGQVGQTGWAGCEGMLIVDTAMLRGAGSTDVAIGGDGTFQITGPDANVYTFADSAYNVFTGQVTDMSSLFRNGSFNGVISYWDTSSVTNMSNMFRSATSFNQPIGVWDTSSVTNMSFLFNLSSSFNQPLSTWNTSNVLSMTRMFEGATAFNSDVSGFDTSKVTTMASMFRLATAFNQPIGGWNTASVTSLRGMFSDAAAFDQNIGGWDMVGVTDTAGMFYGATTFNQPLSGWNVSTVADMESMFRNTDAFDQDISGWNVSGATNMTYMFDDATAFNRDLSGWCVSGIPSAPLNFDRVATSWVAARPVWGTCP